MKKKIKRARVKAKGLKVGLINSEINSFLLYSHFSFNSLYFLMHKDPI